MSESRFGHLLQPIRDLSKNWNIDLAQELEEYLEELEHLNISFDPQDDDPGTAAAFAQNTSSSNNKVMNFAEAALLIQGTSVIYSRKVEYLYALVFQTLAHLSKQQEEHQHHHGDQSYGSGDPESNGAANSDNGDIGGDRENGLHSVFANPLPIYNELEEARNITLKRSNASMDVDFQNSINNSNKTRLARSNIQASIALMGSLVPDERDHGETFKLLSCNLHSSGVLLLDEASRKYLTKEGRDAMRTQSRLSTSNRAFPMIASGMEMSFDQANPLTDANFGGGDDGDDNHYEPDDYAFNDDFGGDDDAGNDENNLNQDAHVTEDVAQSEPEATQASRTRSTKPKVTFLVPEERDPWTPLDPYDASSSTARPFRKGRSYPKRPPYKKEPVKLSNKKQDEEVMDGVDDPDFKERFFFGANRPQWSSWVWNETKPDVIEKKFHKKFCKAPLLTKTCDELWKLEAKWNSLLRRREAKEEQSANAILIQEEIEEEEEQMHAMNMNSTSLGGGIGELELHEHEEDDGGDDYDDGGAADFEGGDWDQGGDEQSNYLDSTALLTSSIDRDLSENGPLSYEEICRQHLESFMQGTEKYVRETDLSKQVNDWQSKLNPMLKEQDQRPPFNIHTCGREIIEHLEKDQKLAVKQRKHSQKHKEHPTEDTVVPFGDIVGGMRHYQVCRMFLASLQLANNGNVQLMHAHTAAEQSQVPFQMQLLSTSNVYESLQVS